jgi:hypothetical protein
MASGCRLGAYCKGADYEEKGDSFHGDLLVLDRLGNRGIPSSQSITSPIFETIDCRKIVPASFSAGIAGQRGNPNR